MKDSPGYTIGFAAIIGISCAALLTGMGEFVSPYRLANEEADAKGNILRAMDPSYPADASAAQVLADFEARVQPQQVPADQYTYTIDGKLEALAVAFKGAGLWDDIEGYLALEPDGQTVRGIAITVQTETPGLGGEIASPAWLAQWSRQARQAKGQPPLRIIGADGTVGVVVRKGTGATGPNEVDGITGATITGDAVGRMINQALAAWKAKEADHGQ